MAAAELEHHESETDVVRRWRFDELLRAGYDIADAAELALRTEIDLHWAVSLVQRGCPSATATRIAVGIPHDASAPPPRRRGRIRPA